MPARAVAALVASLALASPALAQTNSGAYLAARHAAQQSDFEPAARFFTRALVQDPRNAELLEGAIGAYVSLGDTERAVPVARRMVESGAESQIANLVLLSDAAARESWNAVLDDLEAGQSVGPLFDGLLKAWAEVGRGSMADAIESFDAVVEARGVRAFGLYHKAIALASVGDFEGADEILVGQGDDAVPLTRRGIIAHAQILSQLERNDEAIELFDAVFGESLDPALRQLRERLVAGETIPFDTVRSPRDGVAETVYSIAGALQGEANDAFTLLYARLAEHLRPDMTDAILMSADLLEELGQYEMAVETYRRVPRDDPAFHVAELGRAGALEDLGRTDAAIEVMQSLAETHGDASSVHVALGDALRRLERYEEATAAYDRAIALFPEDESGQWGVYFARGITHERSDTWPEAEADFRKALELRPNQPQVLNYLGYSFVEMGENLGEALDLIERAVAAEPNSGYIVDSLGWVYYRLGRYPEAVRELERATELLPTDPILTDHLGDALWAVDRKREARFQWRRALSFDPEDDEAERIRRKLEVGLDVVLEEEGAEPIAIANDDG
jgi:tetratricopeptide (TPR) repeat protein